MIQIHEIQLLNDTNNIASFLKYLSLWTIKMDLDVILLALEWIPKGK